MNGDTNPFAPTVSPTGGSPFADFLEGMSHGARAGAKARKNKKPAGDKARASGGKPSKDANLAAPRTQPALAKSGGLGKTPPPGAAFADQLTTFQRGLVPGRDYY